MRVRIEPGGSLGGDASVPGDKSIAHRLLILASTAKGRSELRGLPNSLDVTATARCLARLIPRARPSLEVWASKHPSAAEHHGFTWDPSRAAGARSALAVEGEGRDGLESAGEPLDCANSGTTMRLLAGVVASAPFATTLTGDQSLRRRPMERVARPLRAMGAEVTTSEGRPPIRVAGGRLQGISWTLEVPSAQAKGCLLLAGSAADGETTVVEPVATRDHTERALAALGAPVTTRDGTVGVSAFQHEGFEASVPGDVSSAAFLVAGAALTGSELLIRGVGLNPTRTRFLDVMERMGVSFERRATVERLGEPEGVLLVHPAAGLVGTEVAPAEVSLLLDEVPVLAVVAAHAEGETRFRGAGELRVKESDRLTGIAEGIRGMGGLAAVEGNDLVVGGVGLAGGFCHARGDHRMAMAFAVGALRARSSCEIEGMESADVSFPGFLQALVRLGVRVGS
ncbi:MAG: 3-phosphoshikimate 1-carboxyvinyltransferase [Actinomycetota bacterium]